MQYDYSTTYRTYCRLTMVNRQNVLGRWSLRRIRHFSPLVFDGNWRSQSRVMRPTDDRPLADDATSEYGKVKVRRLSLTLKDHHHLSLEYLTSLCCLVSTKSVPGLFLRLHPAARHHQPFYLDCNRLRAQKLLLVVCWSPRPDAPSIDASFYQSLAHSS
jgi:hypothetical protein